MACNIDTDVRIAVEQDLKMSGIDRTQLRYNVTIHKPHKYDKFRKDEFVVLSISNNMVSDILPVTKKEFDFKEYGKRNARELADDIAFIMQKHYPCAIYYEE